MSCKTPTKDGVKRSVSEDLDGRQMREEGVGSEVGSHCNLTGSSPAQASAAVLLKEA